MEVYDIVILVMLIILFLAWLAFPIYTGILLFFVEVNVECFARDARGPVNVAE